MRIVTAVTPVLLLTMCAAAAAQQAPSTQPATAPPPDLSVLQPLPADTVAVVVVPGIERLAGRIDAFVSAVVPRRMLPGFDSLQMLRQRLPLGEDFDASGSLAVMLLDPAKYAPQLVAKAKESNVPPSPQQLLTGLPWVVAVPAKGTDKLFRQVKATRADGLVKLTEPGGGQALAWVRPEKGHALMAMRKATLGAFPVRRGLLPKLNRGHEKMLARDHVWVWVDRKRIAELHEVGVVPGPEFLVQASPVGSVPTAAFLANPVSGPAFYAHMTRDEIFSEATSLAGGIQLAPEGIRIEVRWSYPEDSLVGKALASWSPPNQKLITRLPDLAGAFAYGATKSFRTPARLKEKQYRELLGRDFFARVPDETKDRIVKSVLKIQQQVTSVEHYAGLTRREGGYFTFATVVRCKSADELIKAAHTLQQAAGKVAPSLPGPFSQTSFQYVEGSVVLGDLRADAIDVLLPMLPPPDEEARKAFKNMTGDDKLRVLLARVDDHTLVTTFMGGEDFLKRAVQAARRQEFASREESAATRRALKMLPARRAVEFRISPKNALATMTRMMDPMQQHSGDMPTYDVPDPIVGAVGIQGTDLSVVGYVPQEVVAEYFRMMQRVMGM